MKIEIPPDDDEIIISPQYDEIREFTKEQYDYIKERLSHPTWFCPRCNLTNHHFNRYCARCKWVKNT